MEDIKNIKYLLRDINIVRKKFEEREKNEDNFNMFTILRKESDEVYLHSRFISALLDPNGPHRLGTIFLNSFLDRIESDFEYDEKSLEVYPNNQNRSEYKEIDICFIDRVSKKALMIENKIYHEDGKAYIAFDTPEELEAKRNEIKNFQYDASTRMSMRNSLAMPKEEVDRLISEGVQYVVRFNIEPNEDVHVNDIIRGDVVINSSILDDKVLYKSADELPTLLGKDFH